MATSTYTQLEGRFYQIIGPRTATWYILGMVRARTITPGTLYSLLQSDVGFSFLSLSLRHCSRPVPEGNLVQYSYFNINSRSVTMCGKTHILGARLEMSSEMWELKLHFYLSAEGFFRKGTKSELLHQYMSFLCFVHFGTPRPHRAHQGTTSIHRKN